MKCLPKKFRESQTDWFGKRGISWHLTVAYRCVNAVIEAQTFVRLFKTCTQDSNTEVSVMKHTVEELKKDHPSLTSLYVRSDNAGCYHNVLTLQVSKSISETTGVTVKRIDFCEPQGGKGSCDRQAAMIKSHIKAWINEEHNVETADEFKAAVESNGGVPGVKVYRCEVNVDATVTSTKFEGITKLNNFEFTDAGLRVWRAFDIGEGKLIPWSKLPAVEPSTLVIISEPYNPGSAFRPVESRRKKSQPQLETESDSEEEAVSHETPAQTQVNIFQCPEEGCVKVYQTFRGLDAHVAVGRHNRRLERETLLDKAKLMYAAKLEKGPSEVPRLETASEGKRTTECPVEGWALRGPRKRVRFTAKQTAYLERTFHLGERTGKKSDPQTVAKAMRHARDLQGQRLFGVNDFLTTQQVSSYFSRLAGKRQKPTEDDEVEQLDPAVLESVNSKVQNEVMNNVHSLQKNSPDNSQNNQTQNGTLHHQQTFDEVSQHAYDTIEDQPETSNQKRDTLDGQVPTISDDIITPYGQAVLSGAYQGMDTALNAIPSRSQDKVPENKSNQTPYDNKTENNPRKTSKLYNKQ
uniref:C2H2-type domain-containing protein n=1 Tax=Branchiostoma floridae TaxID=7739 RepID=C3YG19_BRAFL|eukprot:XP_002604814.1 hypothetical protein BRAFLDRAFT_70664 [Branchiostoma floridae]